MNNHNHFDIRGRAYRAMRENGFEPEFPPQTERQLQEIEAQPSPHALAPEIRDLRGLLWSSIDNTESRDLDQIEVAERLPTGAIRILVAIADVDALVANGSPADLHARENSTSVYTGVQVFPMLPEQFSTNLTSLNPNTDRVAVVIENVVEQNGDVSTYDVYRGLVRNQAQLASGDMGRWLVNTPDGTMQQPSVRG